MNERKSVGARRDGADAWKVQNEKGGRGATPAGPVIIIVVLSTIFHFLFPPLVLKIPSQISDTVFLVGTELEARSLSPSWSLLSRQFALWGASKISWHIILCCCCWKDVHVCVWGRGGGGGRMRKTKEAKGRVEKNKREGREQGGREGNRKGGKERDRKRRGRRGRREREENKLKYNNNRLTSPPTSFPYPPQLPSPHPPPKKNNPEAVMPENVSSNHIFFLTVFRKHNFFMYFTICLRLSLYVSCLKYFLKQVSSSNNNPPPPPTPTPPPPPPLLLEEKKEKEERKKETRKENVRQIHRGRKSANIL